jgi:hypothetical protein
MLGEVKKGGRLRWFSQDVVKIPVKQISAKAQQPFIALVDILLAAKQKDKDVSALEKQIDELVYELYGIRREILSCPYQWQSVEPTPHKSIV